jgi:hypothetical protein
MGYIVEISVTLSSHYNFSELKSSIESIALFYSCNNIAEHYEMEGGCKFPRHHCILAVSFDDHAQSVYNCANFIKKVKQIKETHIESVYEENSKLIYASPYYLKTMDKGSVESYTKFKRERSYSDGEIILLRKLQNKKSNQI